MSKVREGTFDILVKYLLLIFAIAMMVVLVLVLFSKNIDPLNRVIGSGISVVGIIGTVLIAIFKNELDKAKTKDERLGIMQIIINVFSILKSGKKD